MDALNQGKEKEKVNYAQLIPYPRRLRYPVENVTRNTLIKPSSVHGYLVTQT
ncbi:hypothetical protein RUM43_008839, partial [Polyplax serrata]